jgi:hypothetical protein
MKQGTFRVIYTGAKWIDPAIGLLIVVVALWSPWGLFRESMRLSLDAAPEGIDPAEVRQCLKDLPSFRKKASASRYTSGAEATAMRPREGLRCPPRIYLLSSLAMTMTMTMRTIRPTAKTQPKIQP